MTSKDQVCAKVFGGFLDDLPWNSLRNPCEVLAPAKINLRLKVLGRRPDGYHLLSMLNATSGLCDTLTFALKREPGVEISMAPTEALPISTADNLVTRAFDEFWRGLGCTTAPIGLTATIQKRIPTGGGLGGGSSDAAAVLRYLVAQLGTQLAGFLGVDELWLRECALQAASRVGADVPYAYHGGLCWVTGVGEVVHPLSNINAWNGDVLLAIPPNPVPTVAFYNFFRELFPNMEREAVGRDEVMEEVCTGASVNLSPELLINDFEAVVVKMVPVVGDTLRVAREYFPETTAMTGSGSTVFSLAAVGDKDRVEAYTSRMSGLGVMVHKTTLQSSAL